jgi:hypothetical protein
MLPAGPLSLLLALFAPAVAFRAAVAAAAGCSRMDRPIVAEVFYDATGDDTGHEFLELLNPVATTCSLGGLRLEAGDGAGPGRWTLRWTGQVSDSIAGGGRFVIGGALVQPPPNAIVNLDLQNGPDAVRLVWPDGAIEVVGYGALAYPEYFCGEPAVDVPSGQSLARVPDLSNRGTNALDFRASSPSPGRANLAERDAELIPGSLAIEPEQPDPEHGARLTGRVANRGATGLAAGVITVRGAFSPDTTAPALFAQPIAATIAAGESAAFGLDTGMLDPGKHILYVRLALPGDGDPGNDRDSLRVRVGPGPLEITEIQFHPGAGEGEWVEVRNRAGTPLDLPAFTLSDRGATRGVPGMGSAALAPESLAVLAQDRAALLARFPGLDSTRVWAVKPWAALNNSNDSSGTADAVVLREADGTPCARTSYSASGVPPGVPIELRSGGWWPSRAPLGTPLAPPQTLAPIAGRFEVIPRRVRPGTGAARLAWSLPWERARVTIELYDLSGRRIGRALADAPSAARGEYEWSAAGLAPGFYLAVLIAHAEGSGDILRETVTLRVEGAAP